MGAIGITAALLVGLAGAEAPAVAPKAAPSAVAAPAAVAPAAVTAPAPSGSAAASGTAAALASTASSDSAAASSDDGATASDDAATAPEDEAEGDTEGESHAAPPAALAPGLRYTSDLTDEELKRRFRDDLPALGTISVGFADQGRLVNAVHMPADPAWICQRPDLAWGTKETVEGLALAFRAVREEFPDSAPARLSHIGARDGGYLRPHKSHQSGRDADVAFFYKKDQIPGGRGRRERYLDLPRNWTLLRALVTQTDVQVILVDRGVQDVLRRYALDIGEDPAWLDRLFRSGKASLVQHARNHRDHFHVRFYAPRSQELGRRIAPLLALRPDQNLVVHRVRHGQTLGSIAKQYGTTVAALKKANRLRRTFLSLNQRLLVPLRKPCTHCPVPPAVLVPPRCLPPGEEDEAALTSADDSAYTQ